MSGIVRGLHLEDERELLDRPPAVVAGPGQIADPERRRREPDRRREGGTEPAARERREDGCALRPLRRWLRERRRQLRRRAGRDEQVVHAAQPLTLLRRGVLHERVE